MVRFTVTIIVARIPNRDIPRGWTVIEERFDITSVNLDAAEAVRRVLEIRTSKAMPIEIHVVPGVRP